MQSARTPASHSTRTRHGASREAIEAIGVLAEVDPWWIEEPTSPDDVLGHRRIREAVSPIRVATGEHVQNRVVFKQLLQLGAIDVCQLDCCRLGGVNEVLAVLLLAAKFGVPVCPHAGGVGLCEYSQHISMFDYVAVAASFDNRVCEYVDHLHEHFVDPVHVVGRPLPGAGEPGFQHRDQTGVALRVRVPQRRRLVEGRGTGMSRGHGSDSERIQRRRRDHREDSPHRCGLLLLALAAMLATAAARRQAHDAREEGGGASRSASRSPVTAPDFWSSYVAFEKAVRHEVRRRRWSAPISSNGDAGEASRPT